MIDSTHNRRGFLRAFGIGAAAVATTGTAVVVAKAEPAENLELLALAGQLDHAQAALAAARGELAAARVRFQAIRPVRPDETVAYREDYLWNVAAREGTAEDGYNPADPDRRVYMAVTLRREMGVLDKRRRRIAREIKAQLATAEAYEAELEAAVDRTGLRPAIVANHHAEREVERVAEAITKFEPATQQGLVILARGVGAYAAISHCHGIYAAHRFGHPLVAAVAKIIGTGA